jgi:hypothetical protein
VLRALCARAVIAVDLGRQIQIAEKVGADAGLFSGDDAVRASGPHRRRGAELVQIWPPHATLFRTMASVQGRTSSVTRRCPSTSSSPPHVCSVITVLGLHPRADQVIDLAHT